MIALILACHTRASAQADKYPPWLEMLKNDKRLQVKMSIDLRPDPTVEAWFAAIKKETGVTLTLADPPKTGRIKFDAIIVAEPKLYAWGIMRAGGTRNFNDPVWEKTEDGYRLHAKPKRIITPEAAKLEARKKAIATAPKVLFDLPKGHPLRVDPKYNVPHGVKLSRPLRPLFHAHSWAGWKSWQVDSPRRGGRPRRSRFFCCVQLRACLHFKNCGTPLLHETSMPKRTERSIENNAFDSLTIHVRCLSDCGLALH